MPTPLFNFTTVATYSGEGSGQPNFQGLNGLTTPSFGADVSADGAYLYFMGQDRATLRRLNFPAMTGKIDVAVMPATIAALVHDPTDNDALIVSVDGGGSPGLYRYRISTNSFESIPGWTFAGYVPANDHGLEVYGNKLWVSHNSDLYIYDFDTQTTEHPYSLNYVPRFIPGANIATDVMVPFQYAPNVIVINIDRNTDQAKVVAGRGGTAVSVDGDALTVAKFNGFFNGGAWRIASDLFYFKDDGNFVRWVQNGQVGSTTLTGKHIIRPLANGTRILLRDFYSLYLCT